MALKAYPLNDTNYTAEDAQLYTATRTSGVYADNHFNISVTGTDNDVTIKPGIGWMKLTMFQGIAVANDEDFTINAGVPDSVLPRIDAVVYAYDANANKPEIIIKQGEKGTTPTPPAVVRDDFRHELHLYHIRRRPGATAITSGDITDLRMDANYCGLMADSVTQVDMSAINAQVREFITDWENQIANVTDGKMIESPEYPGCYYRMNRGVKEWLNPPMMEDVEYPTTKRQDGKRVYTKLLKARSMAGSVSLPDIERIVSVFAVAERDWNGEKLMFQLPVDFLPEDSPTIQKMQIYYQGNTIVFQSVVAKGLYNLYITVEYTKPGDEVAYTNVTADGDTVNVETNGNVSAQGDNLNVEMFTTVSADGGAYIRRLTINGVAYDLAVGQAGSGAPGTAYPGVPGQFYTDLDSGEVYVCVGGSADAGVYIWRTIIPSRLPVRTIQLNHKTGIGSATITATQGAIIVENGGDDAVLHGIATPTNANDAANKQYVDGLIGSGGVPGQSVQKLPITDMDGYKIAPTGTILAGTSGTQFVSEAIAVSGGDRLLVTGSAKFGNSLWAVYDTAGGLLLNETAPATAEGVAVEEREVDVPDDAASFRVAWDKGVSATSYAVSRVSGQVSTGDALPLSGVKCAIIGDSIVEKNATASVNFVDLVSTGTGAQITNLGVGGTGWMNGQDDGNAFYQRVSQIPEDTQRVLLYGSGNDRLMPLGEPTDTGTDTLCGCINTTLDAMFARVPTAWVGVISPAPWQNYPPYEESNAMALMARAQAMICRRRGVPYLDLYHSSGLRPWDDAFRALAFADGDGVHPNDIGHSLIAPQIQAFLLGAVSTAWGA